MSNLEIYMNRILPMVGNYLRDKKIAFYNLEWTHRIAEAFARCGVRNFVFYDHNQYCLGTNIFDSYAKLASSGQNAYMALETVLRSHYHYETGWNFMHANPQDNSFESCINFTQPDLIIGGGNIQDCTDISEISKKFGIPAIIFTVFSQSYVNSAVLIIDARHGLSWSIFDKASRLIKTSWKNRLGWLEASALAGLVAKVVLFKGTEHQDKFLEKLLYKDKRNNILRGTSEWPWWVFYGSYKSEKKMLELVSEDKNKNSNIITPNNKERLMIIGCGTGSLLAEEAVNYFDSISLIDCKPFSVYNPVRQYVATKDVESELVKPFVLLEIFKRRYSNGQIFENAFGKEYHIDKLEIWASELKICESEPESIDKFHHLLDAYKPTIVVVGMGQARDDNFTVSRILRDSGIKHVVPGIFPLATHYKHIIIDGSNGPCYGCLQGRLIIDTEGSVELTEDQREMFYGFGSYDEGTQPATIFETWPSCHSLLRLVLELSLKVDDRSEWMKNCLKQNQTCFVGANSISLKEDSGFLYGTNYPGQIVTYAEDDIVGMSNIEKCPDCGRIVHLKESHII